VKVHPPALAPVASERDPDGDMVPDSLDNCPAQYHPSQRDPDGDGLGDRRDPKCPDLDALNPLAFPDFALMASAWRATAADDLLADLTSDSAVDALDLHVLAQYWLSPCLPEPEPVEIPPMKTSKPRSGRPLCPPCLPDGRPGLAPPSSTSLLSPFCFLPHPLIAATIRLRIQGPEANVCSETNWESYGAECLQSE
jgi:hypothetical protein